MTYCRHPLPVHTSSFITHLACSSASRYASLSSSVAFPLASHTAHAFLPPVHVLSSRSSPPIHISASQQLNNIPILLVRISFLCIVARYPPPHTLISRPSCFSPPTDPSTSKCADPLPPVSHSIQTPRSSCMCCSHLGPPIPTAHRARYPLLDIYPLLDSALYVRVVVVRLVCIVILVRLSLKLKVCPLSAVVYRRVCPGSCDTNDKITSSFSLSWSTDERDWYFIRVQQAPSTT